ncbi:hypothetical protein M422DRAFT_254961 [Sphaerobolus stellatus SS14]|uniref:Uncharacterized protein n=1 Tax=Sphaerobolus stellatus (strain SS14) TaxID=990650 RepID=A0A0C9UG17_SPHS4|nr:hypothetical protein M422DRAFT_254961 [Sphaerobolus stellatus SS14]
MKEEFGKAIEIFEEEHNRGVGKGDFVLVFGTAFLKAAQPELIKTSFSATGSIPFNLNVISAEKMKLGKPTSVKGTFPLVQPSPVRAAVKYLDLFCPTSLDRNPEYARAPTGQLGMIPEHRELDPVIDPVLQMLSMPPQHSAQKLNTPTRSVNKSKPFTPSKAVRILISQLSATVSGSFLVSESPLKSTTPILIPILEKLPEHRLHNWDTGDMPINTVEFTKQQLGDIVTRLAQELTSAQVHLLACDDTISRLQAQLIIQNMHLIKLNRLFPDGFGRILTDDDCIALQEEAEARKAAKELQKTKKNKDRLTKKSILEEQKHQWDRIRQEHEVASATYKAECTALKALGVRKTNWPKAPKRKKKPTLNEICLLMAPVKQNALNDEDEVRSQEDSGEWSSEDSEDEFFNK